MVLRWLRSIDRRLHGRLRQMQRNGLHDGHPSWLGLSAEEAFSRIYAMRLWGGGERFHSGAGSHDPALIDAYVAAIRHWVAGRGPLDAVDLGCGDFNVGARIRPFFRTFVACDVVPDLIEHLRSGPHARQTEFLCLDLARDVLPPGDVVFIRQVLQHLPNHMILSLVPRLSAYRWLVLTEHLPASADFVPNLDKPLGPGIRLEQGSGVDLCAEPFCLAVEDSQVLCEVPQYGGVVRTTLYRLRDQEKRAGATRPSQG